MPEMKLFDEYGLYRVDEQGVPFLNDVVWDFLERRNISAEVFGKRFGELVRKNKQPYTKGRIYQMLHDNTFPTDNPRRWVLAKLLQIPPVLMGVQSLDDLLPLGERSHPTASLPVQQTLPSSHPFDSAEYRQALRTYWRHNNQQTLSPFIGEIDARIHLLERKCLYREHTNELALVRLLCGYHCLRASHARDRQEYDTAIDYLNKAYILAKDNSLPKLQAGILDRRGVVFKERGEAFALLHNFEAARRDLALATDDFTLTLNTKLSPVIQGSSTLSLGRLQSETAKTPQELHQTIRKIQSIEPIIGKTSSSPIDPIIEVSEERYHLNRAAAYLASPNLLACYPQDARRELRDALAAAPVARGKRRQVHNLLLETKSYVIEGQGHLAKKRIGNADDCFNEAVSKARMALVIVKKIDSQMNVMRIEKLCSDLRATPFGEANVDLASLEVEIATAKYPQLFQ